MNLFLLLVVIWLIVRLMRGAGALGHGGRWRYRGVADAERRESRRPARGRSEGVAAKSRIDGGRRTALPPESPMDRLQRQFVAGELTVEEYERELDRVIRRG